MQALEFSPTGVGTRTMVLGQDSHPKGEEFRGRESSMKCLIPSPQTGTADRDQALAPSSLNFLEQAPASR